MKRPIAKLSHLQGPGALIPDVVKYQQTLSLLQKNNNKDQIFPKSHNTRIQKKNQKTFFFGGMFVFLIRIDVKNTPND